MNKLLTKKEGFTLIEIVLVLAIAGLILVVVFLAVGGANRANRDTQRTNLAGQLAAALESYARNHNGQYPSSALPESYTTSIIDIDTRTAPKFQSGASTSTSGMVYSSAASGSNGYICNDSGVVVSGGTPRNYAISYWSEQAGGPVCKDNQ